MIPIEVQTARNLNEEWLRTLTEPQLRALAYQHGMENWKTAGYGLMAATLCLVPQMTKIRQEMVA